MAMIAVVILAGGDGRRIGGDKPRRLLAGKSLLDHALGLARRWSPRVAVSVRDASSMSSTVPLLTDREGAGPIAGIAAALAFARDERLELVLTIPCDTPFLPADLPEALSTALTDTAGVALAASGGRLHPSCALWRTAAAASLAPYLATGRNSLHGFATSIGGVTFPWPSEPFDPFFNINSEADLAVAEEMARKWQLFVPR